MNPNQVLADVTQGGLSPQEIKDCTACHTRGYILGMGDVLATIHGLRAAITESGRQPDFLTVLAELEVDVLEAARSASETLTGLLEEEK